MSTKYVAGLLTLIVLVAPPTVVAAQVRDIPNRSLAGEYVVTVQEPAQSTFIDVRNVDRATSGTLTTHIYMVEATPADVNGKTSPFQAYQITYDCVAGSMHLDNIDYVDGSFGLIATMTPPPDFKAWSIGEKPDLVVPRGFREVCHSGQSSGPRIGRGRPWTELAASMRSKLSATSH